MLRVTKGCKRKFVWKALLWRWLESFLCKILTYEVTHIKYFKFITVRTRLKTTLVVLTWSNLNPKNKDTVLTQWLKLMHLAPVLTNNFASQVISFCILNKDMSVIETKFKHVICVLM